MKKGKSAGETDSARVVSVNLSQARGMVKKPVPEIALTPSGVLGDAHSGNWHRQVSLIASESVERFSAETGRQVRPGEFAENITVSGIDLARVKLLDKFRIGSAELEVTQIGKTCHGNDCAISREIGRCIMPREGIFCRVIQGGTVKAGDKIESIQGQLQVQIITLSDRVHEGKADDLSGPRIEQMLLDCFRKKSWRINCARLVLPDDPGFLKREIERACGRGVDLIITTGGTGIGPRDNTPEVIISMADKIVSGIMEHIRIKYGRQNPRALLSRSVAALIGSTLVYAIPGSVKAAEEYMQEILKILEHSILMIKGIDVH